MKPNTAAPFNSTAISKGIRKHLLFIPTRYGHLSAMLCIPTSAKHPKLTVIMAHGIGPDNSMVESGRSFLRLAELLAKQRISSLMFAFPGTAESDGVFSDMAPQQRILALQDIINWFINNKMGRYALLGFSMGAATAIHALGHRYATDPEFLITINSVPSFDAKSKSYHQWHAPRPQPDLAVGLGKRFFSFKPKRSVGEAYGRLGIPKLHVQSGRDIPYFAEEFRKIFDKDKSVNQKKWIDIPGADHSFVKLQHQKQLFSALISWINTQNK